MRRAVICAILLAWAMPALAANPSPKLDSVLFTGSSTGTVTVQPDATAGTWTWTWPTSAGNAGQCLISSGGSGPITWGDCLGSGGVSGPGSSTVGHVATWNNTSGTLLADTALSALLDGLGSAAQGDVLYRGASGWALLAPGTSGNFLQTQGASANPQWAAASASPGGSSGQVQYNNAGAFGGLTNTQLTADINTFTTSLSGAAPASGGGTANFLRADGTWAPAGTGTVTSVGTSGGLTGGPITSTGTISCIDAASTVKGCPTPDGTLTHFLNGAGGWTIPAGAGSVTSVGVATPNSTLSLGGTNPVTSSGTINIDLNLSHPNTWLAPVGLGVTYLSQQTANASVTGTTVNRLAKLTSTGAVILATTDTSIGNLIGVCASACGTTGSGVFATTGTVPADFDNATVAGDYVVTSTTTAGKVHDAGATLPTGVNVVGFADSTNAGGAGTYALNINPVGIANATGTSLAPGGSNNQVQYKNGAALGGFTVGGDCTLVVGTGAITCTKTNGAAFASTATSNALTALATQAANTVVANVTSGSAAPTAASLPGCTDTGGNHLNYTSGTGFSCGTSGGGAPGAKGVSWDSGLVVTAVTIPVYSPTTSGTIDSVTYYTNGASATFDIAVKINGTNVTSCNALTVSSSSATTTNCTAANTFSSGNRIEVVTSNIVNSPAQALVQINYH